MKHLGCSLLLPVALTLLFWRSLPAEAVTAAASYQVFYSTNLLGELEPCG